MKSNNRNIFRGFVLPNLVVGTTFYIAISFVTYMWIVQAEQAVESTWFIWGGNGTILYMSFLVFLCFVLVNWRFFVHKNLSKDLKFAWGFVTIILSGIFVGFWFFSQCFLSLYLFDIFGGQWVP